jgi:enoyl-CoA hydratase
MPLKVARDGPIATVTFANPSKLNALTLELWTALGAAFRDLDADASVRCIVLRGADKNFAPGADISEFPEIRTGCEAARRYSELMHATMAAIAGCRHPTVALIEGVCVGGGLELASCCDLRIAGASSRFGVPIARIGVTMGVPEIAALIDLVGRAAAMSILLEARVFGAAEALAIGLITRSVADDRVEAEALESAARICAGAPLVHQWHKRISRRLVDPKPIDPVEADGALATFDSEDFRAGISAFLAKRKPSFNGH